MCGIAGILRVYPPGTTPPPHLDSIPEAWLDILDDSIKHRGPDGQGRFRDRATRADGSIVDVALVHRRLSIIDHAGGAQPMVSLSQAPAPREGDGGGFASLAPSLREGIGGGFAFRSSSAPAERVAASSRTGEADSTFRGLKLPVLFHGKPNDAVHYKSLADPSLTVGARDEESCRDLVAVVFNGCIYNHRELRRELQATGHEFVTDHSDTEVLLHGWREWGNRLPDHLDSMHSFAIWSRGDADLFVSRDRHGEKPLYYARWAGDSVSGPTTLVFDSETAGVLRVSATIQRQLLPSTTGTRLFLRFGYSLTNALFEPISTPLASASEWRVGASGPSELVDRPWLLGHARHPSQWTRNVPLSAAELDDLLDEAVASRLPADVPLGCFLSGGIDSSLVALYAKRRLSTLRTFTVRMPDANYDESPIASRVGALLGTTHLTLDCDARPSEDLVDLIEHLGLPFGDSSLLPTFWVSRAARQHVGVAVGGDGGDELFAGYDRHVAARWLASPFLQELAHALPEVSRSRSPKGTLARVAKLLAALRGSGYWDLLAIFPEEDMLRLAGPSPSVAGECFEGLDVDFPGARYSRAFNTGNWHHAVADCLAADVQYYLPEDLLRKTDTASMAVALEVRSPLLARELSHRALSAPISALMPRGQRKGLLRAVARKYLPREIVDRPKMGFAIPVGEWFRTDFGGMKTLLLDMLHSADPFPADLLGLELNRRYIEQMLDEHMNLKRDHSQRLYMLLVLAIWCRWLRRVRGPRTPGVC